MSYESLTNEVKFMKPGKTFQEGETFEGYFQETKENEFGKTHYFSTLDKKEGVGINGTARLDGLMQKIEKGWKTKITYEGKKPSKKGQPAHSFKVFKDSEDVYVREVAGSPESNSGSNNQMDTSDIPL